MQAAQRGLTNFFLISLIATLTACGGGGSDGPSPDSTPDDFSFSATTDAEPGEAVISEAVTIRGINVAAPVSVSGGEYSIAGEDFTSAAGNIEPGQSVRLRVTASSEIKGNAQATLTIGSVEGSYTVTTLDDTTAPQASITFPPPMSAIDASGILIRGVAQDDYSDVQNVTIVVESELTTTEYKVDTSDGFANWTTRINLAEGENKVVISTAADSVGNVAQTTSTVTVHRQPFDQAFPDNDEPFREVTALAHDPLSGQVFVSDNSMGLEWDAIISIDLETGRRTMFSDVENPGSLIVDQDRNRLVMARGYSVLAVNLDTGVATEISSEDTPHMDQPEIGALRYIAADPTDADVGYLADTREEGVSRIDLVTGERTLVTANSLPDAGPEINPRHIVVDVNGSGALVPGPGKLVEVDLATGSRSVIVRGDGVEFMPLSITRSDNPDKFYLTDLIKGLLEVDLTLGSYTQIHPLIGGDNGYFGANSYIEHPAGSPYLFWLDERHDGLFAFDLESKTLVTISRSMVE